MSPFQQKVSSVIDGIDTVSEQWLNTAEIAFEGKEVPFANLSNLSKNAARVAAIHEDLLYPLKTKCVYTLIADHGIAKKSFLTDETEDPQTREGIARVVERFFEGATPAAIASKHNGCRVKLINLGCEDDLLSFRKVIQKPAKHLSQDFSIAPSMKELSCWESINKGVELVEVDTMKSLDVIGIANLGFGAQASALTVLSLYLGQDLSGIVSDLYCDEWHDELIEKEKINSAYAQYEKNNAIDPIDVISKVGGHDIAAATGICLAASFYARPVVIDGLVALAGAISAVSLCPKVIDYLFFTNSIPVELLKVVKEQYPIVVLDGPELFTGDGLAAVEGIQQLDLAMSLFTRLPN